MAPSEAQKRASLKWNNQHMASLGCRVRKDQAEAFKAYCDRQGKSSNAVLKEFVLSCIRETDGE